MEMLSVKERKSLTKLILYYYLDVLRIGATGII